MKALMIILMLFSLPVFASSVTDEVDVLLKNRTYALLCVPTQLSGWDLVLSEMVTYAQTKGFSPNYGHATFQPFSAGSNVCQAMAR